MNEPPPEGPTGQPPSSDKPPDVKPDAEPQPVRLISRIRAVANTTLLVSGLFFLLGFLLTIALAGTLSIPHMRILTTATAYIGFIALVSFITSFLSILIENRTGDDAQKSKEGEW